MLYLTEKHMVYKSIILQRGENYWGKFLLGDICTALIHAEIFIPIISILHIGIVNLFIRITFKEQHPLMRGTTINMPALRNPPQAEFPTATAISHSLHLMMAIDILFAEWQDLPSRFPMADMSTGLAVWPPLMAVRLIDIITAASPAVSVVEYCPGNNVWTKIIGIWHIVKKQVDWRFNAPQFNLLSRCYISALFSGSNVLQSVVLESSACVPWLLTI